jgi:hypothetical protein
MNKNIIEQIEQISAFSCLSCSISYQDVKDVAVRVSEFLEITGIISRTLKPSQVQKDTRLKTYNTMALPTSLNGCETWAIREYDKYRIT